ncbi:MAG: YraN family protein [Dethiobacter sp.]|nr:YraN family protein [Dethiobacter sp.]MBS3899760.1 YraN family protein [Dethiobacter sp.]MBS3982744.1 YraN family protein [Dethiobacter sp.]MCL4464205.1 YraN family protein [Bacillota bacterium]MCL5993885.1 YraN family protein [Bacillota bacterium]
MKSLGKKGEELAATYLAGQGYVILARNWCCQSGELDIVAKDGDTLVFIEVKTRSSTFCGSPAEAVDAKKQEKVRLVARHYLYENKTGAAKYRFDVVAVNATDKTISIIKNAF